jgi:hypothetical protein
MADVFPWSLDRLMVVQIWSHIDKPFHSQKEMK